MANGPTPIGLNTTGSTNAAAYTNATTAFAGQLSKMRSDAAKDDPGAAEAQQHLGNPMESGVELSDAARLAAEQEAQQQQGPNEQQTQESADRSGATSLERRSYGGPQTEDDSQHVHHGGGHRRIEQQEAPLSDAQVDAEFEATGGAQTERKTSKNRANMDGTQERAEQEEREARLKEAGARSQQVTSPDGLATTQSVHDPMAIEGISDRSMAMPLTAQGVLDGQLDGNAVPKDIADAARSMLQMDSAGQPTEKQKQHKTLPPEVGASLMLPQLTLAEGRDHAQPLDIHETHLPFVVGEMEGTFAAT
jgi:hypothetical protein